MAWDDEPPKPEELDWMQEPPRPEELDAPVVGGLEAALRGAAQGASFGFSDEIQAVGRGVARDYVGESPDGMAGAVKTAGKLGLDATNPAQAVMRHVMRRVAERGGGDYRTDVESVRRRETAAAEQNPGLYMGGEMAGAMATAPLIPGAGGVRAAGVGSKLLGAAKTGAKFGALMGAGSSDADLAAGEAGELAGDVAMGAGAGVATAPIGVAGAEAATRALKIIGTMGKRLIPSVMGPSEEAVQARLTRPDDIIKAKTYGDIAETLPSAFQGIKDRIKTLSGIADETLSTSKYLQEGAITKDEIMGAVKFARSKVGGPDSSGVFSPDAKAAASALENATKFYKKLGNTVSQKQVKTLINQLDNEIPWKKQYADWSPTEKAMATLRGKFDEILKTKNPDYAKSMVPVADEVRLLSDARQRFRMIDKPAQEMRPSDTTAGAIKGGLREERVETQRLMDRMKQTTGMDLRKQAEDRALADEFVPSRAAEAFQISRPVASTVRAFAGKPSERAAADLIDWYVANKPGIFGRFAPMLGEAAQRGSLAVTNYVLQQRDPEYQAIIRGLADANEKDPEDPSTATP